MNSRIQQAIEETQRLLNKALSYSRAFQKPAQIKYYREHLDYLRGKRTTPAKADTTAWDDTNCVIEARTHTHQVYNSETGEVVSDPCSQERAQEIASDWNHSGAPNLFRVRPVQS